MSKNISLEKIQKELEQVKATSRINEAIAEIKATINNKEEQLTAALADKEAGYKEADPAKFTEAAGRVQMIEDELTMLRNRLSDLQKMPLISDDDAKKYDAMIRKAVNAQIEKQHGKLTDLIDQFAELLTDNGSLYTAEESCRRLLAGLSKESSRKELSYIENNYFPNKFRDMIDKLSYYIQDRIIDD